MHELLKRALICQSYIMHVMCSASDTDGLDNDSFPLPAKIKKVIVA